MQRRDFLKALSGSLAAASTGCGLSRIDPWHYRVRSDVILSPEQEKTILDKAKVSRTEDGKITVLWVQGNAYERGYQQGVLRRKEIQDNLGYLYEQAYGKLRFEELFDEVYERMRPFIPQDYIDEMHGLAHGAKMPLRVIHSVHIFPSIGEWSGTKKIKEVIKQMMAGDFATTCSNFMLRKSATADNRMYVVRILDWGMHRVSKLHFYPQITVSKPENGLISANIGWSGFLGAVSGMNEQGITLGEMGYGSPENETLRGTPMIFLLREVLKNASNLQQVRHIIETSPGTNSFVFLMSDGKTGKAELYVRDRERFIVGKPGEHIKDGEEDLPGIQDTLYGGARNETMTELLRSHHGQITPQMIMEELIPPMVLRSNFQNVLYDPEQLRFWVNNAFSKKVSAKNRPYTAFDLKKAITEFPG